MNSFSSLLSTTLQSSVFWCLVGVVALIPLLMTFLLPQSNLRRLIIRSVFWFLGALFLLLGIIGIVLPVLPTTPFILLTAACWARASPHFHRWLCNHRYFGPMVRNWEAKRAVPRRAKYLAISMMTLSCAMLFWRFPEQWWLGAATSVVCLCTGIYLWQRPDA